MKPRSLPLAASAVLLLGACASLPSGPSILVLPGTGKNFDQFRLDDMDCRQYAYQQVGGKTAEDAANETTVRNAAIGTAIGALAGAAIGGRGGAGVGAGSGLLIGSMMGAEGGYRSSYAIQRQYDNAFVQCMYAKGHRVPTPAGLAVPAASSSAAPPSATLTPPPPPPGNPPPPPPSVR